jgi:hypothetical protein
VEFRLTYKGSLPAQGAGTGGSRIDEKHAIRRQIHGQLRELWYSHIVLRRYTPPTPYTKDLYAPDAPADKITQLDIMARKYAKFGYNFLPLVNNEKGIACSLDILFLRRDAPGNLIQGGGDIDNRIKVLFDGLRLPKYEEECPTRPQDRENPFFCLLEDDALITEVKITTDRLLVPMEQDEKINDVHLVIHVTTKILDPQKAWPDFVF